MDNLTKEHRRKNMQGIRSCNTKPELIVRKNLWKNGIRYRLNRKDLPGKPDLTISKYNSILFIHGCFWHKHNCKYFKWPKSNIEYWTEKIQGNAKRDKTNAKTLQKLGWHVYTVWECEIKHNLENTM